MNIQQQAVQNALSRRLGSLVALDASRRRKLVGNRLDSGDGRIGDDDGDGCIGDRSVDGDSDRNGCYYSDSEEDKEDMIVNDYRDRINYEDEGVNIYSSRDKDSYRQLKEKATQKRVFGTYQSNHGRAVYTGADGKEMTAQQVTQQHRRGGGRGKQKLKRSKKGKIDVPKLNRDGVDLKVGVSADSTQRLIISEWNNRQKFNGFFFGINMTAVQKSAFRHPYYLFDPRDKIVNQEDKFVLKLIQNGQSPKVSLSTFVYHFKGITVAANAIQPLTAAEDKRENLAKYHPEFINITNGKSVLRQRGGSTGFEGTLPLYPPYEQYFPPNSIFKTALSHNHQFFSVYPLLFGDSGGSGNTGTNTEGNTGNCRCYCSLCVFLRVRIVI